jgi:small subunit ribosomal protein S15
VQEHDDAAGRYKRRKHVLIRELQQFEHDTGTMPVQIGLLTERIRYLTKHTEEHKKDKHSRRGLMILLSRRKKQLRYLRKKDFDSYVKARPAASPKTCGVAGTAAQNCVAQSNHSFAASH